MGFPLIEFLPTSEAVPAMKAIDKAFDTDVPVCHTYSYRGLSFFWLIDRVDDLSVAVHEVFDVPKERARLKKFLLTASGNFYRTLYNKETG